MKFSLCVLVAVAVSSADAFTARSSSSRGMISTKLHATETEAPPMARSKSKQPVFDEVCETTGVTLTRFMNEVAMLNPELRELTTLFGAIDTACKAMTNVVKRSQLPSSETLGYQGAVNIQGEDQKKLDVITNDILKRALRFTGRLGVLASEEEDVPVSRLFILFQKFVHCHVSVRFSKTLFWIFPTLLVTQRNQKYYQRRRKRRRKKID
ncbi:MAG: fructose-1,6-bisphosphatase I [Bacillariaceae sp.]|jgi:fructose-1,6-bisphosphatase I